VLRSKPDPRTKPCPFSVTKRKIPRGSDAQLGPTWGCRKRTPARFPCFGLFFTTKGATSTCRRKREALRRSLPAASASPAPARIEAHAGGLSCADAWRRRRNETRCWIVTNTTSLGTFHCKRTTIALRCAASDLRPMFAAAVEARAQRSTAGRGR